MNQNLTDKQRMNNVFKELNKSNIFAKPFFSCCNSCATSELSQNGIKEYIFTTLQDKDDFNKEGKLISRHHLRWECDSELVLKALKNNDFEVIWDGTTAMSIIATTLSVEENYIS